MSQSGQKATAPSSLARLASGGLQPAPPRPDEDRRSLAAGPGSVRGNAGLLRQGRRGPGDQSGISGSTILDSGRVALILDVSTLLRDVIAEQAAAVS